MRPGRLGGDGVVRRRVRYPTQRWAPCVGPARSGRCTPLRPSRTARTIGIPPPGPPAPGTSTRPSNPTGRGAGETWWPTRRSARSAPQTPHGRSRGAFGLGARRNGLAANASSGTAADHHWAAPQRRPRCGKGVLSPGTTMWLRSPRRHAPAHAGHRSGAHRGLRAAPSDPSVLAGEGRPCRCRGGTGGTGPEREARGVRSRRGR